MTDGDPTDPPAQRLPGLDDVEHRSWERFLQSADIIFDVLHRKMLAEHDLTLFDVLLLKMLARSTGGSARMGDLANALTMIPSRVTQQAARLEARGLLKRHPSPGDRRVVLATITQNGRTQLEPALRTYSRVVRKHYLNPLSRPQMSALGDSCRRINDGLTRTYWPDRPSPR